MNLTNKNFNKGSQIQNKTYCIILLKQCSKTEKEKKKPMVVEVRIIIIVFQNLNILFN